MTELSNCSFSIGLLGVGNMGGALCRGLISRGLPPKQLLGFDPVAQNQARFESEFGGVVCSSATALVKASDVVILAMKPATVVSTCREISAASEGKLFLSVAAGVTISQMAAVLSSKARVARSMPNTPAMVGAGASAFALGPGLGEEDRTKVATILASVGLACEVPEHLIGAVTGLSGSGPAYVFLMIEALADGAVKAGLPRDTALRLAAHTVRGAATLQIETGKHPGELKDAVASPGGTTIYGLATLEQRGVRGALMEAVVQAALRADELSKSS